VQEGKIVMRTSSGAVNNGYCVADMGCNREGTGKGTAC